ncbi:MAG: ABC transporter permease subunit [Oscillospiraceae bacterium]
MKAIFRREFISYFTSPIGYVFLGVFYFFAGLFMYTNSVQYGMADLTYMFFYLFVTLVLLIPILTMRVFSEEKRQKTDQLLLSSPVSLTGLVAGKFLAAFAVFMLGVAITFVIAVVFSVFASSMQWVVILGNILGLLLLGSVFISVGIFISSLTENQVISAIGSIAVLLVFLLIDVAADAVPIEFISKFISSLSIYDRYYEFCLGIINISNVLLFVSMTVVFNFLTIRVLDKRRWS